MFRKTAVMMTGLLVASVASAQGYVDIHLGQAEADLDLPSVSGLSWDKKDTTYSLNLGYKVNKFLAIEGGYTKLGEASVTAQAYNGNIGRASATNATGKAVAKVDGYVFGLAATLPINNAVDLTARAGVFAWKGKVSGTLTGGSITYGGNTYTAGSLSGKEDGTDPYWGLGAGYNFSNAVRAGVNFTRYKGETSLGDVDVDTWTANLRYSF